MSQEHKIYIDFEVLIKHTSFLRHVNKELSEREKGSSRASYLFGISEGIRMAEEVLKEHIKIDVESDKYFQNMEQFKNEQA